MNILQKLRVEHGYTLTALSEASGVDRKAINNIELGKARPQKLTLAKLAKALGVEIEILLPLESSGQVQAIGHK